MNVWEWFTGGAKTTEKVLDGITRGVDALVLTEEERIQYKLTGSANYLEHMRLVAAESTPQAVSRRVIAWGVIGQMIITINICIGLVIVGKTEKVKEIADLIDSMSLGWAFVAVIVFYFGTHVLAKMRGQ